MKFYLILASLLLPVVTLGALNLWQLWSRAKRRREVRAEMQKDHGREQRLKTIAEWQRQPTYYTRDLYARKD